MMKLQIYLLRSNSETITILWKFQVKYVTRNGKEKFDINHDGFVFAPCNMESFFLIKWLKFVHLPVLMLV